MTKKRKQKRSIWVCCDGCGRDMEVWVYPSQHSNMEHYCERCIVPGESHLPPEELDRTVARRLMLDELYEDQDE